MTTISDGDALFCCLLVLAWLGLMTLFALGQYIHWRLNYD